VNLQGATTIFSALCKGQKSGFGSPCESLSTSSRLQVLTDPEIRCRVGAAIPIGKSLTVAADCAACRFFLMQA